MISFRPATMFDCADLWRWRIDPETRKNSFNTEIIPIDFHTKWLQKVVDDKGESRILLIIEEDKKSLGTLRLDLNKREFSAEISWTVAPFYRKQGIGKRMLLNFILSKNKWLDPSYEIHCKIRSFNQPSIKIAILAGFELMAVENEDTLVFKIYSEKFKDHKYLDYWSTVGKLVDENQELKTNKKPILQA